MTIKKIYFAAILAMVVMLGVQGCANDDENNTAKYYPNLSIVSNEQISIFRLYGVNRINLISRLFEYVYQIPTEELVHENNIFIQTVDDHSLSVGSLIELNLPEYYDQINNQ